MDNSESCYDFIQEYLDTLDQSFVVNSDGYLISTRSLVSNSTAYLRDHTYCKVLPPGEEKPFGKRSSLGCREGKSSTGGYDLIESFLQNGDNLDRGPSPSFSQASTLCSDDEVDASGPTGAGLEEKVEFKKRSFSRRIRKSKDWWSCSNWRRDVVRYKKALMLKRSKIESNGVFSTQKIPAGACLVEYMGERIPSKLADERERNYVSRGIVHDYMFRIDDDITIDATCKSTHISKYINHSCEPNACSKVVSQDGRPRVVIVALRDIDPNEEITYDYAFPIEDDPENRVKCLCGAPSCRGFIN